MAVTNYSVTLVMNATGVKFVVQGQGIIIANTTGSLVEPPYTDKEIYVFTVTLPAIQNQAVTVNYSTFNGTGSTGARAGTDFSGLTNVNLVIPAGSLSGQIDVTILGDAPELPGASPDEYFTVHVNWAVSAVNVPQPIATNTATGDIKQTFVPTVSVAASQIEHVSTGDIYNVPVHLTSTYPFDLNPYFTPVQYAQAAGNVSVSYYTSNGTAKAGVNYVASSAVLSIPWSAFTASANTVTIPIKGIGPADGQIFGLSLGSVSSNATLVAGSTASANGMFNPQLAEGTPTGAPGGVVLTSVDQLTPIVNAAEASWEAAGVSPSLFNNLQFQIANIGRHVLGNTAGRMITIDAAADGFGWYLNPTGSAFQPIPNSNELFALAGSLATGHMDLLTVMEHELGHVLGLL